MFKRFIFVLLINFLFSFSAFAGEPIMLTGSVAYTVESARELAFSGLQRKIDKELILPFRIDENNKENRLALKNNTQINGRTIMAFYMYNGKINGYVITYNYRPEYSYYYTTSGYLVAVDVDDKFQENTFPYKIGKYSPLTGNLISIALYISDDEQYAYTKDGKLKAHWVGNIGYNEKGKIIARRSVVNAVPQD